VPGESWSPKPPTISLHATIGSSRLLLDSGRLEQVPQLSAALLQGNPEIVERLAHLCGDITASDYSPLIIEPARTRGDDQPV
jgi:hypothetical protein